MSKLENLEAYITQLTNENRLTAAVKASIDKALAIRRENDHIIYLAGALTGVSDEVKFRYDSISQLISRHDKTDAKMFGYAPHLHGTDPVTHPDVTPAEVRDIDYMFAAVVADSHINFLYPLAHGNAIEEAWAEEYAIPALYVCPDDMRLSRLTLGMRNVHSIIRYDDFEATATPQIEAYLQNIETVLLK